MKTIAGVFPTADKARETAAALKKLGIADEEILIASGDEDPNQFLPAQRNMSAAGASGWGWLFAGFMPAVIHQPNAVASAGVGAAIGAGAGIILGLVARAIPMTLVANVHPILAAAAAGAFCAFGAGLSAYVYALGVSHEAAAVCAEAAREHGIVVEVHVSELVEEKALALMKERHAAHLRNEDDPYRATGWRGKPIDPHRYPSDSEVRSFHAHA